MRNERITLHTEYSYDISDYWDGTDEFDLYMWAGPYDRYRCVVGDPDNRRTHSIELPGQSKGYPILIRHNGLSKEFINHLHETVIYGFVVICHEEWNPEVGKGWVVKDSIAVPYRYNPADFLEDIEDHFDGEFTADDIVDKRGF